MEVVLGIDIGTSSTKGLLVTLEGQVIKSAQWAHQISLPRPGWAEADAEDTWWYEVRGICNILSNSARLSASASTVSVPASYSAMLILQPSGLPSSMALTPERLKRSNYSAAGMVRRRFSPMPESV